MKVDEGRLREDLLENASFGRIETKEGHGRTVLLGSDADRRARERLVSTLESLGATVRVDSVGNVAGRWSPEGCDDGRAPVAAGSHLDSVPEGGIFDGPLGVYAAVESVRAIAEAGLVPERPIEIVAFTEEEGQRFDVGLLGSSVAVGERRVEEALALTDDDGTTLETHVERIGFRGEGVLDASEWDSWVELHVEQATRLEQSGASVGVVSAITGITNCVVEIDGEANHAGGTRMNERTDALVAAGEFVESVERIAHECCATGSEAAVATVGSLSVEPNARNVVPGSVRLTIDVRDVDRSVMDGIVDRARSALARIDRDRGTKSTLTRYRTVEPTPMSERCREAFTAAADRRGVDHLDLPSGGGHDTMAVASVTDAGLLFAPSRGGISHSPAEWTDWADCARATQVLADTIAALAGATGPDSD
jgi:beta-ureidopropionase / N-carbamoyl-L-amino-acid hydrolase